MVMNKYKIFENEVIEDQTTTDETEQLETINTMPGDSISAAASANDVAIVPQITSLKTVGHSRFIDDSNGKNSSTTVIISDPADLNSTDADVGSVYMFL